MLGQPSAELVSVHAGTGEVRWSHELPEASGSYAVLAARNGQVYVGARTPAHLLRVAPGGGEVTEISLPAEVKPDDPLLSVFDIDAAGGLLYVRIGDDFEYVSLYTCDPANDSWGTSISTVAGLSLPSPGPNEEIYVMRENVLTAYDPAAASSPRRRWSIRAGSTTTAASDGWSWTSGSGPAVP